MASLHDKGTRTGWLYDYYPITIELPVEDVSGKVTSRSALSLLFQDHAGDTFYVQLFYNPYFLVLAQDGHEREVEQGLMAAFGSMIVQILLIEKEDLALLNHLSGRKRTCLKVILSNTSDLVEVRTSVERILKRNSTASSDTSLFEQTSLREVMTRNFDGATNPEDSALDETTTSQWANFVQGIREYDVKYSMRVAIDLNIFVGLWYDTTVVEGVVTIEKLPESKYAPAMPLIIAFDIETTKAPLKFPQPEEDQIYMISYMLGGRGYLIINREIVTADIHGFEYTPRPEYEGCFDTFNEKDEASTLRRFFDEIKKYNPNVFVTYNGDYFDFPFIHARSLIHGMNMRDEIGFSQMADGAFLNQAIPHLDCFYWVKRDSYLPQGSQGLKAVTKSKLGYEPIEVDPEEMLPLAQNEPQKMASYSVSDAVSTWYLYLKYVHPFIFSLATIIPMSPDDVLRKGSGGLCESLLMVQANAKNVLFPNKKETVREKFYDGHLIDSETYIGGRVEALRSGVYRADLPLQFNMNPDTYQSLINDVHNALEYAVTVENGLKREEVENFDETKADIIAKLCRLRDHPKQQEFPLIYHLDVGAMYPNIILTNRLQPYAIPPPEVCAGCCFHSPTNEHQCKRTMAWKWRGELFTAGKYEFQRVKAQLENESFAQSFIDQTNLASVQKKAYGNRKGNVLENTKFERKNLWGKKRGDNRNTSSGSGYRRESAQQRREAANAFIKNTSDSDEVSEDEDGSPKEYQKLNEQTQFNMLKKRLGEYSRKVYGKIHTTVEVMRSNVVCQRENSFYVDTVRLFRDRRYEYKEALKQWKKKLSAAKDLDEKKLCESRCVQMESLQLAHKCILNSFYGYVMRKGSRWYSMEMAGLVTYLGASLIQMARALVQQLGVTLELDTDGIWCSLPKTFPENYILKTNNAQKPKISLSYPCIVLNKMVHDRYTNNQYQTKENDGSYSIREENSIYFEVDGPYLAMLLPASREEGKTIKKRYAVFHLNGKLAELKGFELKRRGELMLVKDFQSQVFHQFLAGDTLKGAYASAAAVANIALDMLESKGEGYSMEEVLEKISESSNMSRRLSEYPDSQKSLAITTARRIAEFLGPQMVKDKGLSCRFIISRLPIGRPVTERAIPVDIFRADPVLRTYFIRKWTGDPAFPSTIDFQQLLDWEYYTGRFTACVQKIITIPAALQNIPNPVPRVAHPDWLEKKIKQQNSNYRQLSIDGLMQLPRKEENTVMNGFQPPHGQVQPLPMTKDMEDLVEDVSRRKKEIPSTPVHSVMERVVSGSDGNDNGDCVSEDEVEKDDLKSELIMENENEVEALRRTYFSPNSTAMIDSTFFEHPGARLWLQKQKQNWGYRSKLRREIIQSRPKGDSALDTVSSNPSLGEGENRLPLAPSHLDGHFIDLTSRAITHPWHIVEVRSSRDNSDLLTVIAVLEQKIQSFEVRVPRYVIVDVEPACQLPEVLVSEQATTLKSATLPRQEPPGRLYQLILPPGRKGESILNDLSISEGVRSFYEAHVDRKTRFWEKVGCCAEVNGALHLENTRRLPVNQRNVFHIDELNPIPTSNYLGKVEDRSMFIYHTFSDARGVVCVVNRRTSHALVIFIQAAAVSRPNINWGAMCEEARQKLSSSLAVLHVSLETSTDMAGAWRLVHQKLTEALESPAAPVVAILQSAINTTDLLMQRALPPQLPYLRILGAADDEKLLGDAFRWSRLLARRFVQRYYSSAFWFEERVALSRMSGIPMCNIRQDSCLHVLDVLYTRALHQRSHILWCSKDADFAFDVIEERPRNVALAGGYTTWSVEFSLSRLEVVALLFSQMIRESDDHVSRTLCDKGISSHFNILGDFVADLLGKAVKDVMADTVLRHVSRWIRSPESASYEPRLIELLSRLSHRVLTSVLKRLAKLGGKTVKVDTTSVIVLTPKHSLQECVAFSDFITNGVQDQPMLTLLSLHVLRFISPMIILNQQDFGSLSLSAEVAKKILHDREPLSSDRLSLDLKLFLSDRLPNKAKNLLHCRLKDTMHRIFHIIQDSVAEASMDPAVILATKSEFISKRVRHAIYRLVVGDLQKEIIAEVDQLRKSRELYTNEEKIMFTKVAEVSEQTALTSSRAVALEYTKCLCELLALFDFDAVGSIKNNCMQLCGVSPFSTNAKLRIYPLYTCRHQPFICIFCTSSIHVDLAENMKSGFILCPECAAPIPVAVVEAHLVRLVTRQVIHLSQQDFKCSRCHSVAETYLAETCCGPLEGVSKNMCAELKALAFYSDLCGFTWLKETVENALFSI